MNMKWFNLPGAKEAYIQEVKLRWVNDTNLDIPWLNFSVRSATNHEFFILAFPEQAWILKRIHLIDESIDETLDGLERLVPTSCKSRYWIEESTSDNNFFDYYRHTDSMTMQRQRESILHYAEVLSLETYHDSEKDRLRLETFRSTCIELVETACLKDRAKLIGELLSSDNTAALLSAQPYTDTPIWEVRREALRRGLAIQKGMQKMREALGLGEEDYEEEDSEVDDNDGDGDSDGENEEDRLEEERGGDHDRKGRGKPMFEHVCKCDPESDDRSASPQDVAPDTVTDESQRGLPVRGCSSSGTAMENTACEMEGDWTSVADENESHDREVAGNQFEEKPEQTSHQRISSLRQLPHVPFRG